MRTRVSVSWRAQEASADITAKNAKRAKLNRNFYKSQQINLRRFRKKRNSHRTRIRTDKKIREYPFDQCHPCSLPPQHRLVAAAAQEARLRQWRRARGGGWGIVRGGRSPIPHWRRCKAAALFASSDEPAASWS